MSIFEFAKKHRKDFEIHLDPCNLIHPYSFRFARAKVKNKKGDIFTHFIVGIGSTMEEAGKDYVEYIQGRSLVFDLELGPPYTEEIDVPNDLTY